MWQERGSSLGLNESMVTYSSEVLIISKLCHCQILFTPIMFLHVVNAPCCSVVSCTVILFRVYEKSLNRRPMLWRVVSTGILLPISTPILIYYVPILLRPSRFIQKHSRLLSFIQCPLFSNMLLCKTRPSSKIIKSAVAVKGGPYSR